MNIHPLIHQFWSQPAPAAIVTTKHYGPAAEWRDAKCEIYSMVDGSFYCAMCCDGDHCKEPATFRQLEDYRRYTAQLERNNALATAERLRYEPLRTERNVNEVERTVIG